MLILRIEEKDFEVDQLDKRDLTEALREPTQQTFLVFLTCR